MRHVLGFILATKLHPSDYLSMALKYIYLVFYVKPSIITGYIVMDS